MVIDQLKLTRAPIYELVVPNPDGSHLRKN